MTRARHRHVEEAPLFLDLGRAAGRHVRRQAAVDHAQHRHRAPLLSLGRMNGREDQVVLVVAARAGLVARRRRRIERELGEEAIARRIAAGKADQVGDVGGARCGVVVQSLEQRAIPALDRRELRRPRRLGATQATRTVTRRRPTDAAAAGAGTNESTAAAGSGASASAARSLFAPALPMPGTSCSARRPARCPRGLAAKRSTASTSLTCAASRKRRPPYFTNGMSRRASSSSSAALSGLLRKRTAWLAQREARLAQGEHALGDPRRFGGFVFDPDQGRPLGRRPIAPERFRVALGGARDDGVRGGEERRRRTVVLLERQHRRRRRELAGEVEDVAHLGGAKRVDRLRVVADDGQAAPVRAQAHDDLRLQPVRVLVLVDEDVVEARGDAHADDRIGHRLGPPDEQVVEIEDALAALLVGVGSEQATQVVFMAQAPRERFADDDRERLARVDDARVDRQARRLLRKAPAGGGESEALAQDVEQRLRRRRDRRR